MIKKKSQVIISSNQQIKVLKLDKIKENVRHIQNNIYNITMDNIKIIIDESEVYPIQNLSKIISNELDTSIDIITLPNGIQQIAMVNEANRSHEKLVSSKSKRKSLSFETGWDKVHKYKPMKKRKVLPDESQTGWKNLDLSQWKVYPKIIYKWGPIDHTWSSFLEGVLIKQKPNLPYEIILCIFSFIFRNKKTALV